jgi:hypothetical protein
LAIVLFIIVIIELTPVTMGNINVCFMDDYNGVNLDQHQTNFLGRKV